MFKKFIKGTAFTAAILLAAVLIVSGPTLLSVYVMLNFGLVAGYGALLSSLCLMCGLAYAIFEAD